MIAMSNPMCAANVETGKVSKQDLYKAPLAGMWWHEILLRTNHMSISTMDSTRSTLRLEVLDALDFHPMAAKTIEIWYNVGILTPSSSSHCWHLLEWRSNAETGWKGSWSGADSDMVEWNCKHRFTVSYSNIFTETMNWVAALAFSRTAVPERKLLAPSSVSTYFQG